MVLAEFFKVFILASSFVYFLLKRMALVLLALIFATLWLNNNWFANYVALEASIIIILLYNIVIWFQFLDLPYNFFNATALASLFSLGGYFYEYIYMSRYKIAH